MKVFADRGLTTGAIQRIADNIGVSRPYVFRLFGTKRALFLACLDELEGRLCEAFQQARLAQPHDPMPAVRASFRQFISDGVVTGLWLQACAAARADEVVAARCRCLIAAVLDEIGCLTGATAETLADFLAYAAHGLTLQALGMDIGADGAMAIKPSRDERTPESAVSAGAVASTGNAGIHG
jgi:AcrR family transcriptional regulator